MARTRTPNLSHEDAQATCAAMSGREAPFMVFTGIASYVSDRRAVTIVGSKARDMKFDPPHVARTLRMSWSRASARQWTEANPAAGQCNVTALLVYELFGGELLKTRLPEGDHFYNWIDGQRYDFTESQFSQPICYADVPTTPSEAERGATSSELAALKAAFVRHSASSR